MRIHWISPLTAVSKTSSSESRPARGNAELIPQRFPATKHTKRYGNQAGTVEGLTTRKTPNASRSTGKGKCQERLRNSFSSKTARIATMRYATRKEMEGLVERETGCSSSAMNAKKTTMGRA